MGQRVNWPTKDTKQCKNALKKWRHHNNFKYFPNNLCEAVFHDDIEDDDYILCPYYSDGDFQVGVTGSIANNETYKEGMLRELGEEIGLKPRYSPADVEFLSNSNIKME